MRSSTSFPVSIFGSGREKAIERWREMKPDSVAGLAYPGVWRWSKAGLAHRDGQFSPGISGRRCPRITVTVGLPASHATEELATPAVYLAHLDDHQVNRVASVPRGDQRMSAPRGRCCTQVPTLRFGGRLVARVKAILPGKRYWLCLAETKWGLMSPLSFFVFDLATTWSLV